MLRLWTPRKPMGWPLYPLLHLLQWHIQPLNCKNSNRPEPSGLWFSAQWTACISGIPGGGIWSAGITASSAYTDRLVVLRSFLPCFMSNRDTCLTTDSHLVQVLSPRSDSHLCFRRRESQRGRKPRNDFYQCQNGCAQLVLDLYVKGWQGSKTFFILAFC